MNCRNLQGVVDRLNHCLMICKSDKNSSVSISLPSGPINLPAPVSVKPDNLTITFLMLPVGTSQNCNYLSTLINELCTMMYIS